MRHYPKQPPKVNIYYNSDKVHLSALSEFFLFMEELKWKKKEPVISAEELLQKTRKR